MRADKRYYVNADRSKIVEEDDPSATYLLAAEGDDITNEDVRRYGLGDKKVKAEPVVVHSTAADPEPEAKESDVKAESEGRTNEATDTEAKAVDAAPENKAVKPAAKK